MDQKAFLQALTIETKARLMLRSDAEGLRHLLGHWGLIAVCGTWIGLGLPLWWALFPVQGVLFIFLFTLEHEATHKTPFASERLNEVVGHLCGFLLLLPFLWFRYFHLAHHRWTNIDGQDPELAGEKPATWAAWAWHVSGLPYWGAQIGLLADLTAGKAEGEYLPTRAVMRVVSQARWMVLGYGVTLATLWLTPVLFWVWLLPMVLGQPALRVYLMAEHGDCPKVANMFMNTRTTYTTAVMRFLAWNMPYHTEHHVFPAVPFYRLPELHRLMRDELRVTSAGYSAFTAAYLARRRR